MKRFSPALGFVTMLLASCSSTTDTSDQPATDTPAEAGSPPTGSSGTGSESASAAIGARAESLRSELIDMRREIHRHPELSGQEVQTAALIEARLRAQGLEVRTGVGGHGVVGVLRGGRPGPVVAYRADMDAMPNQEPPGRAYGSTVPNVFHVCGHDLHSTIGVGVATALASMRDQLQGTAVFLFQPAEETVEGAAAMLRDGALDGLDPQVIYGLHSFPNHVGTVFAQGTALAGFDNFTITLDTEHSTPEMENKLKADLAPIGTIAPPETGDDIAKFVADLQDPNGPYDETVFLRVSSSTVDDRLVLRGSLKASDDSAYERIRDAVREAVAREVPEGTYELAFRDGGPFPAMRSDNQVADRTAATLAHVVGKENVLSMHGTVPYASEDFAFFLQRTPGVMVLLGVENREKGFSGFPHFPDFDADEDAIVIGTKAMSTVIWDHLSKQ
ncbi:M20 metallopeptidase family protein [Labilithrix luteola]|nr:amidohydrolase [Labilithrix luteola]